MARRREINVFSLSFLDLISGALGAVIILYVAVPKANPLERRMEEASQTVVAQAARISELEKELSQLKGLQATAQGALQENQELKQKLAAAEEKKALPDVSDAGTDVGFKFKGRNIVFIIDTSKSMLLEDRMGQVKAGLKMLITSMPSTYSIDVVQFPNGMRTPFHPLYGKLHRLGLETKEDVFDFLYGLKPNGATPTRDVLNYVFKNYPDASDVVLLTDGEPSIHNSALKDDIYGLLNEVRKLNPGTRLQINTIGVGEEVLHDKAGRPYQFLRLLSEQNNGFFVGF